MPTKKTAKPKQVAKKPAKSSEKVVKTVKTAGFSVPVYDLKGATSKKMTLPKEIFSVEASPNLIAQYVRVYLANRRQGNAASKTRAQVKASTRKIYRQKGTGRARHGAKSAPIFVGGGVAFGPHPRDFSLKLNKKQRRKAFFSALTLQYKEGNIAGLVDKSLEIEPKTKNFASLLKNAQLQGKKLLLVVPEAKKNNLALASRNVPGVTLTDSSSLNAYEVLNNEKVIFVEKALDKLVSHFLKKNEN